MPLACASLTIAGLILALVSDGPLEMIGMIALATPLLLLGWKLR